MNTVYNLKDSIYVLNDVYIFMTFIHLWYN